MVMIHAPVFPPGTVYGRGAFGSLYLQHIGGCADTSGDARVLEPHEGGEFQHESDAVEERVHLHQNAEAQRREDPAVVERHVQ